MFGQNSGLKNKAEAILNSLVGKRRSFDIFITYGFGILLTFFFGYHSFIFKVDFGTHNDDRNVFTCIFFDGSDPVLDVLKWLTIDYTEGNQNGIGSLVEAVRECLKSLHSGGIPNFHADSSIFELILSGLVLLTGEVKTQGWHVLWVELAFESSLYESCLTDTSFSDDNDLTIVDVLHSKFG